MMENASVWRRRRTPYIYCKNTHFIHLFDRSKKVFGEPYLSVVAMEVSVLVRSTAVAAEEEAGIEAMVEETGSSDVDGGRGDRWSRERSGHREFWDKK
jgi:hypothetical protein